MSPQSDTFSWFRFFLLNAASLAEKQHYRFDGLCFDQTGAQFHDLPHSRGARYYTTDVVGLKLALNCSLHTNKLTKCNNLLISIKLVYDNFHLSKNDFMASDPRLMTFPYCPLITLGSICFVFETNMYFSNFHYNITQFNLMWMLQSDWLIRLEKKLVILHNLYWYCNVTKILIRQRQIQIVLWNNRN
jgi:hypothetical protein